MTQGEAKVFETEVVLFSVNPNQEVKAIEEKIEVVETVKSIIKTDIHKRFARLRKSLKKRSASIL